MKNNGIIILVLLLILSCQKPLQIDYPVMEEKLVVNCLFAPDTVFQVQVSKSQKTDDSLYATITDAVCELWANNKLLEQLENNNTATYCSTILPEIGKTYTLIVKHPKYENISATSSVPDIPIISNFNLTDYLANYDINSESYLSGLELNINDDATTDNYYKLDFVISDGFLSDCGGFISNDIVLVTEDLFEFSPIFLYFSDELFNGQTYNLSFMASTPQTDKDFSIIYKAKSLSKEHYYYTKKMLIYQHHKENGEMLQAIEPMLMYSNIQNGYGIFAGFSQKIDSLNYHITNK